MELLDSLPTSVLQELLDDFDPGPEPSFQDVSWNSKDMSSSYQATQVRTDEHSIARDGRVV